MGSCTVSKAWLSIWADQPGGGGVWGATMTSGGGNLSNNTKRRSRMALDSVSHPSTSSSSVSMTAFGWWAIFPSSSKIGSSRALRRSRTFLAGVLRSFLRANEMRWAMEPSFTIPI